MQHRYSTCFAAMLQNKLYAVFDDARLYRTFSRQSLFTARKETQNLNQRGVFIIGWKGLTYSSPKGVKGLLLYSPYTERESTPCPKLNVGAQEAGNHAFICIV